MERADRRKEGRSGKHRVGRVRSDGNHRRYCNFATRATRAKEEDKGRRGGEIRVCVLDDGGSSTE